MFKVVELYANDGHDKESVFGTYAEALAYALSLPSASQPGEWGFEEWSPPRKTDSGRLVAWVDITPPGCVTSTALIYQD